MEEVEQNCWPAIVERYRRLVDEPYPEMEPMLRLVEFIAASPYATRLFAITSHFALRIGRYNEFWVNQDAEIRIEFDPRTDAFTFEHWSDRRHQLVPWRRVYRANEGIAALERFLLQGARWFTKHGEVSAT